MAKGKVAQVMRDVRSGGAARMSGRSARRGFTLVEVVVAGAILMVLMLALASSFSRGATGFRRLQVETLAQNLAEFQAEDLKAMAPSVLNQLVEGTYPGKFYKYDASGNLVLEGGEPVLDPDHPLVKYSNYPYATTDTGAELYDATAAANDAEDWMYDSGWVQTDYNIVGITQVSGAPYVAGPDADSAPAIPADLLDLGTTVEILPYSDPGTTWKYYRVILHKEAYPLFAKRVQIERINASKLSQPTDPDYHNYNTDTGTVFGYTIQIRYRQGTSAPVLISTSGRISSPYSIEPTTITVTQPTGSAVWTKDGAYTVSWTAAGDTAGIFAYRVSFSSDDGVSYGAPLAVVPFPGLTANITAPNVDTATGVIKVDAVSSAGRLIASDDSADFTVGTPTPPEPGPMSITVTEPTSASVWTVGSPQTVSWSVANADPDLSGFVVSLSTDGGASFEAVASAVAAARSATVTPSFASGSCVVKVTGVDSGGASLAGDTSDAFTTEAALTLTVTAPTASAVWTRGIAGTVTWTLTRSEPSIASFRIQFYSGSTAGASTSVSGGGARTATIVPDIAGTTCGVAVTALNAGGGTVVSGSSAAFTVVERLSITVAQPSLAQYARKSDVGVQWTTSGNPAGVTGYNIYLSVDGGATWTAQGTVAGVGATSYLLRLPNTWDVTAQVKVEAIGSIYSPEPFGTSRTFSIVK